MFHPILAHGSLGGWDEVIFLSIAAVFLITMGISWIRSRANTPEETPVETPPEAETSDRFPLN